MINRVKPYLLIVFVFCPIVFAAMYYNLSSETLLAKYQVKYSVKKTVPVLTVSKYKMSRRDSHYNYWVKYIVESTSGRINGGGSITQSMYEDINSGKMKNIEVYVHKSLLDGSWPAHDVQRTANRETIDNVFFSIVLSPMLAIVIYLSIAFIPFGKDRKSLSKRWA